MLRTLFSDVLCVLIIPIICDMTCWSGYGENEYIIMTNHGGADYYNAVKICKAENGSLVSIHSHEEHDYVDKLRNEFVGVPVWIGMRSYGIGLVYSWSDQTPVDYLPKVDRFDEPAEGACLYLYYNWYEGDCDNSLHFVCKRIALNSSESCPRFTSTQSTITQQYTSGDANAMSSSTTIGHKETTFKGSTSDIRPITITMSSERSIAQNSERISTILNERTTHMKSNDKPITSTTSLNPTTVSDKTNSELRSEEIKHKVEEIVKTLKIYKLPKRPPREAVGSEAIGAVALFILIGILGIVFLLDLVTIQNHLKLFLRNVRRRPKKTKEKAEVYNEGYVEETHI